jgi:hypothetical protein
MLGAPKKQRCQRIRRDYQNGPAGVRVMISWHGDVFYYYARVTSPDGSRKIQAFGSAGAHDGDLVITDQPTRRDTACLKLSQFPWNPPV